MKLTVISSCCATSSADCLKCLMTQIVTALWWMNINKGILQLPLWLFLFCPSKKCRIRQQSGSKHPHHLWNQKLHDKTITEAANKSEIFYFFMLTWLKQFKPKQKDGCVKGKASRVNSKQQHFLCFWKERVSWAIL